MFVKLKLCQRSQTVQQFTVKRVDRRNERLISSSPTQIAPLKENTRDLTFRGAQHLDRCGQLLQEFQTSRLPPVCYI